MGMSLQIGLVIIVSTPVLSTTWSYWFMVQLIIHNKECHAFSSYLTVPIAYCQMKPSFVQNTFSSDLFVPSILTKVS